MFKKVKYILLLFLLVVSSKIYPHPLHLTVTNIDIKANNIKVTIRVFNDDFSSALSLFYNTSKIINLQCNETIVSDTIKSYIDYNFKIVQKECNINLNYLKCNRDELSQWIYLEGEINSMVSSLTVENNLLNNLYGDQRNLVIVSCNKNEEGFEFSNKETKKTITLVD